jgi:hypothetical protein
MSQTHTGPDGGAAYRTPNWVKAFGVLALVLVVLVGVMLLSGVQHGPGLHMPSTNLTHEPSSQHGMQHP